MKTSSRKTLFRGSALIAVLSVGFGLGCGSVQKGQLTVPYTDPSQFPAEYREVSRVFHVMPTEEGTPSREHVAYVYRQAELDSEGSTKAALFWVEKLDRERIGFVNENTHAFKLVSASDDEGRPSLSPQHLGTGTLQVGVQRILDLSQGTVELVKNLSAGREPGDNSLFPEAAEEF